MSSCMTSAGSLALACIPDPDRHLSGAAIGPSEIRDEPDVLLLDAGIGTAGGL
nr:hypothetical protein [Paenibacillus sp. R14(2021)]